jgi:lipoprotein-anchoring transpeptidase ErfK/SrfK
MNQRLALHRLGGGSLGGRHRARRRLAAVTLVLAAVVGTATDVSAAAPPSVVARATGRTLAVYRSPSARTPLLRLRNPANGGPLVFLVKQRAPGWEQIYLPLRPNGSTGWVRDAALDLALDPYRVVVSLHEHALTVWKGDRIIQREPAGLGRSVMPTPTGTYYVVDLLKQPDPSGIYGPYAFGLSAFSNVLYSFGGGPGQIGLHGTSEPWALGTNVSHGCIRISNAGITKLARILPLGTPVQIVR